ncbi:HAD family hydrolase [Vibrio maerlii]|uniref:HAD family hydrolase n=1 Tax=Vibrio maerlii TaxID=2231648 RepID=UPI000E3C29D0|nr:HAD family phosphatase [Vibrio maerlii]
MQSPNIKNVIFDIGNVIVLWNPLEITRLTFGEINDPESKARSIFQTEIWLDLNKGRLTEEQAQQAYVEQGILTANEAKKLFYYVKQTQILLYGSVELLTRVKQAGYGVYALTDNVTEIVEHLKNTYDFWPLFDGATVSAEVDLLKPQAEIYHSLCSTHGLVPHECVFLDDMPYNVQGAIDQGLHAIQFANSEQVEHELKALGLKF